MQAEADTDPARLEATGTPGRYRLSGRVTLEGLEPLQPSFDEIAPDAGRRVVLDASGVIALDTSGAWLLLNTRSRLSRGGATLELLNLPSAAAALLGAVDDHWPPHEAPAPAHPTLLERLGRWAHEEASDAVGVFAFVGSTAAAITRLVLLRGRFYAREWIHVIETAGARALPIVGLLTFLIGVVIAYQGVTQLARYGATIFVVDLISISVLRELSPLITAIIVAGRTGSAFTAEIGSMKIAEEIDALRILGISPLSLLVVPRILGLVVVLPLLTVFADITGTVGGIVMAHFYGGISPTLFLNRFPQAVELSDYLTGIAKTPVFAAVIASVGCHQGLQVEQGADSVGRQTTVSVVQSIFLVIVIDAAFSVVFSALGL